MGDTAKISPHIASTCIQNSIPCLLIICISPSHHINVAIDNALVIPSFSFLATSYVCNYLCIAENDSHTDYLDTTGYGCFSRYYNFRDGMQGIHGFMYRGEHQG
jgi:hypothetical protein